MVVAIGAYIPFVVFILTETRAPVIIRRRAAVLRKERGLTDGGRYTARSEIGRQKFFAAMSTSLLRPLCKSSLPCIRYHEGELTSVKYSFASSPSSPSFRCGSPLL